MNEADQRHLYSMAGDRPMQRFARKQPMLRFARYLFNLTPHFQVRSARNVVAGFSPRSLQEARLFFLTGVGS
jgi:hypothetical protein